MADTRAHSEGELQLPDTPTLLVTRLNARTFALKLLWVIGFLMLAHVIQALVYWGSSRPEGLRFYMIGMWDLDEEESFGTYFSAGLLLFIGRILWHHGRYVQRQGDRTCWWWLVLAVGFHWLSIDEVVGLHEVLNVWHKEQADLATADRWTTQGLIAAGIVAVAFLPFLWRLRWRTAIWFAVGGVLYVLGAVGVEKWTDWYETADLLGTLEYNLWTCVEEGLEMVGPVIFLHALLGHIAGSPRGSVTHVTQIEP